MIGVWVFCICLFLFVSEAGRGCLGVYRWLFPFFTPVQYYAYEARAHGIVLGWYGLTLVCWQRTGKDRNEYLWLAGFGVCLLGALLTHVYAVYLIFPFALVELYNLVSGRPNWSILASSHRPLLP